MSNFKSLTDVVNYSVKHPYNDVTFTFKRESDGSRHIVCTDPRDCCNRHLPIEEEELNVLFKAISEWIGNDFPSKDPTNSWGVTVSKDCPSAPHRLVANFTIHGHKPVVDVRRWSKPTYEKIFSRTKYGFTLENERDITAFLDLRTPIHTHLMILHLLNRNIKEAMKVIFEIYDVIDGRLYEMNFVSIKDVVKADDFVRVWYKKPRGCAFISTPEELYEFVTTEGLEILEEHIVHTQDLQLVINLNKAEKEKKRKRLEEEEEVEVQKKFVKLLTEEDI